MRKALAAALLLASVTHAHAVLGGGNDVILSQQSNGRHGFSLLLVTVQTWVRYWI